MKTLTTLILLAISLQCTLLSAQVDLDHGLIAYYPFDSTGEIPGTTLMNKVDLPGGLWVTYFRSTCRIPQVMEF